MHNLQWNESSTYLLPVNLIPLTGIMNLGLLYTAESCVWYYHHHMLDYIEGIYKNIAGISVVELIISLELTCQTFIDSVLKLWCK